MKVIFIKNVKKTGQIDEVKDINEGYARNFLIPQKFAVEASPRALGELKKRLENKNLKKDLHNKELKEALEKLKDFKLVIKKPANEEGHLFSGVTLKEIVRRLHEQNINLEEKHLILRSPIKKLGEQNIPINGSDDPSLKILIETE